MNYTCPCCQNLTLTEEPPGTFEICPVCFWEDDEIQNKNLDYEGGANAISLRVARRNYARFQACSEEFINLVRLPTKDEIPTT